MANTKSAAKRARQTERRTLVNKRVTTNVKNLLKSTRAAISKGGKAEAQTAAKTLVSALDRAAKSGRVHRNKANRQKSSLNKKLAALA